MLDRRRRQWAIEDDERRWNRERAERRREERRAVCASLLVAAKEYAHAADWAEAVARADEPEETITEFRWRVLAAQQKLEAAISDIELVAPRPLGEAATRWAVALVALGAAEDRPEAKTPYEQRSLAQSEARKEFLWLARDDLGTDPPADSVEERREG